MNRLQELLTVLQEECGEVIQASTKIVRFGPSQENQTRLYSEIADVLGLIKMLDEEMKFNEDLLQLAEKKVEKVEQHMVNKKRRKRK